MEIRITVNFECDIPKEKLTKLLNDMEWEMDGYIKKLSLRKKFKDYTLHLTVDPINFNVSGEANMKFFRDCLEEIREYLGVKELRNIRYKLYAEINFEEYLAVKDKLKESWINSFFAYRGTKEIKVKIVFNTKKKEEVEELSRALATISALS